MFGLERFGIKLGLANMTEFLSRIGNPQSDFSAVHVAGTNGKGSVCSFLASMLSEAGLKVGLYTSPHLVDFRERITVNASMIPQEDVVRIGNELRTVMESMAQEDSEKQLTFFEFTTGLAFKYFSEKQVDIAVVEVGMGGRLDATNVIAPEVAGVTRVGLEHTAYLGRTLEAIAREKAGIVKEGVPLVTCERDPAVLSILKAICDRKGANLRVMGKDFRAENCRQTENGSIFDFIGATTYRELSILLLGHHQIGNAAMSIALLEELQKIEYVIPEEAVRSGLEKTICTGRLDVWSAKPLVILDGSHNPEGVSTTVRALQLRGMTPLRYVVACMNDKDIKGIIKALSNTASCMILTKVENARSAETKDLLAAAEELYHGEAVVIDRADEALKAAMACREGRGVCVIGSFYLVGEAIKWLNNNLHRTVEPGAHKV